MADQLREEAKSLIKDNVHKQLFWLAKRFFVIFGVTNFTVIVAAFFWIRENLPDIPELKEQAEAAAQRVAEDTARNEVSNLVRSNIGAYSNAVSAQADVIVQSLVETSAQAGSIRKDIVGLQRQAEQLKLIISELSIEAENQSMEVKTINDKISQASVEGIDSVLSKLGDNAIRAAVEAGERLSIIQEKSEDMEKAIAALTGRLQNLQKDGASKKNPCASCS